MLSHYIKRIKKTELGTNDNSGGKQQNAIFNIELPEFERIFIEHFLNIQSYIIKLSDVLNLSANKNIRLLKHEIIRDKKDYVFGLDHEINLIYEELRKLEDVIEFEDAFFDLSSQDRIVANVAIMNMYVELFKLFNEINNSQLDKIVKKYDFFMSIPEIIKSIEEMEIMEDIIFDKKDQETQTEEVVDQNTHSWFNSRRYSK
tara:strand:- start:3300 stop:3905 length:606 start_codon:yes stop_codon:yes gene_type:complete